MKRYKPRAYLEKVCNGHFGFEYTYTWVARDDWGKAIAYGRTRKICEQYCRWAGYVPER